MRLALHITRFNFAPAEIGPTVARTVQAAEDAGFDAISLMDHFFQIGMNGPPEHPMLEGYTGLGYIAALTKRVELQLLVTGVTYRQPGLLAKTVSTLDVLSGGRARLGIGAAWFEEEHHGLGVAYPSTSERFERLEETLQICRQMWDEEDESPYAGKHYQLGRTLNQPPALHRIPIMIGGGGERKTLRLVAQYADACNLFGAVGEPEPLKAKLDVLRQHCDAVGRDYDSIAKTMIFRGFTPEGIAEQLAPFAELGVDEAFLVDHHDRPVEFVESIAPYVEAVRAL